jgi:hypothetical protein
MSDPNGTQPTATTKWHHFKDTKTGLTTYSCKYPAHWNVISKPYYSIDPTLPLFMLQVEGPNNLRVFNTPITIHISYQNPQSYQLLQNSSAAALYRTLVSNQQLIQEEVAPRMQNSGYSFVKTIQLPKSERHLQQQNAKNGRQAHIENVHTVWKNDKGQMALVSLGKILFRQQLIMDQMTVWYYSASYMFVDAHKFEETIDAMETAVVNTKENRQWEQYTAALTNQRMLKAQKDHEIHMRNRWAAFKSHQTKMERIYAAREASHNDFMQRKFGPGSDATQKKVLNMLTEEETVYNPLTGKNYQTQTGYTDYWMDSNENLIMNNDVFYTPQNDINLNDRTWVRVRSPY